MIKDKWIEDIDLLALELPKKHKNLFFHKKEREFYEEIKGLKNNIDYYDSYEIAVNLGKIVASFRDAHTSLSLPVRLLYPIELYWFKDGIYVIHTLEEYKEILSCKITHINNIDIEEVINILSGIVSYENQWLLKAQLPKYLPAVEILYGLEIIDDFGSLEFTCEDQNGSKKTLEISPLAIKEAREKLKLEAINKLNNSTLLYKKNEEKYYWFEYLQNLKTVYFKYNACRNMNDINLNNFCEQLIKFIEENDVEKLIVDFRNNFGGDSRLLEPFIEYVKSSKTINNKSNLFVIVGRETFSSALLNVFMLKENTNAIFIGEGSGGKPNCYGEVERFNLKNSGLTVCYSTKYYKIIEDDRLLSFMPDINIELSIEDYIENIDPCLEFILDYEHHLS
ncbi:S41 family peptidase [Clostridium sp. MSJ-11]|uniref:S41 family peptidase n=1 Tax=Clostridium mobile TaxID=2841512 RepID=A0ABS6EEV9_9CLOT|nr:S41 family peptidase [Clostridium mobile]MBU5483753.1 S41 family peptidase [Clostridium mobile]